MTAEQKLALLEQQLAAKDSQIQQKDQIITDQQAQIHSLKESLILARAKRFARSSEKFVDSPQIDLFDETQLPDTGQEVPSEQTANVSESVIESSDAKNTQPSRPARGKRQVLPGCFERVRLEHTLNDDELVTAEGIEYVKIGETISEQLDIVPADVRVIQHVRFKYAVKGKEEYGVKTAPITGQPIAKSIASSGLLAHMVQAKYCHHLPLYRQEQIWRQSDIDIPRNSMVRWTMTLGQMVQPVIEQMLEQIKSQQHVHVDETRLTVVDDKNKPVDQASHQAWMWLYTNKEAVVYDYQSSREVIHAYRHLEDYNGYVQSDAYRGYDRLFQQTTARAAVGCWAHARRKFTDILKLAGKKKKNSHAEKIVKLIGKLYQIESHCTENRYTDQQRQSYREQHASEVLSQIKTYLEDLYPKTPPKGLLGQAIAYTLNHWQTLTRYLEAGYIPIDNNEAERKIRPFTIGRKNWLFCQNSQGAKASANLYSLIESAKLYNLKIFDYLKYLFEQLPQAKTDRDFEQLTPKFAPPSLPRLAPD